MRQNDKFLKPGTGKPVPMTKPGLGMARPVGKPTPKIDAIRNQANKYIAAARAQENK